MTLSRTPRHIGLGLAVFISAGWLTFHLRWSAPPAMPVAGAPVAASGVMKVLDMRGGAVEYHGASLELPAGALDATLSVTLTELPRSSVPKLSTGMDNVTAPFAGLRVGPATARLARPATLSLPYDPARIPAGTLPEEIFSFYYDAHARRWVALERVEIDTRNHLVVSRIHGFGDIVNGTLTVPDHPEGENFGPSSIADLGLASPGASITLIDPPTGGPTGDAQLDFPIEVPPGRDGLVPRLAITYSSERANGWLGVGWDIDVPNVQVDTTFGVPRYSATLETETYLLDGDFLAPVADIVRPTPRRGDRVFVRRVEGSFQRIIRRGDGPANYHWDVTSQDGTRFIYGKHQSARLQDYQSPGNIFRWNLQQIIDPHGNTVELTYDIDSGQSGEPWVQIYPRRIVYTGGPGSAPYYSIEFIRDSGGRVDRFSSARPGFKTLTRYLLDHIDIIAGGELVRRYRLEYRPGGFARSLLQSIAVVGEDGATELYRHSFAYNQVPMRDGGTEVDGFGAQQTWTGMSKDDDETHDSSFSAGAQSFTGLGPPSCQPFHAGVQVGGGGGQTSTTRSLIDVNGDGLTDRIDENGDVEFNRFDPRAGEGRFEKEPVRGAQLLGNTKDMYFEFGAGVHALFDSINLGASWVWTHANDDHTIADVDGDGRPDLVKTQGSFDVRLNEAIPGPERVQFLGATTWTGYSLEGVDLSVPGEDEEVLSRFNLSNSVRKLILPYTGRVSLTGAVQKLRAGGIDGVRATIHHNGTRVWQRLFASGDTSACKPGPNNACSGGLAVDVQSGDRLYFMADSIADTSDDALSWAPTLGYQGKDTSALEPYGARIFAFDASADFSLAGSPGGEFLALAAGTVRIVGAIDKKVISDDVEVTITRIRDRASTQVYRKQLAAASTGKTDDFPAIAVQQGDVLHLAIDADSQVAPGRVTWTPVVEYQGDTSPPLPPEQRSQSTQVDFDVRNPLPLDVPTRFWAAPDQSEYPVQLDWTSTAPTRGPVLIYVQSVNQLLGKYRIPVGSIQYSQSPTVKLTKGQALYITVLAAEEGDMGILSASTGDTDLPVNRRHGDTGGDIYSGGYHLWYYGEWNGYVPFHEPEPPSSDKEPPPPYVPGIPLWQGLDGVPGPLWRAAGFDLHLSGPGEKPSRRGGNVVVELAASTGKSGAGPGVVRKSYGKTIGVDLGAVVTNESLTSGDNVSQIDLLDMNGDLYPDQLAKDRVGFSNGHGGFARLEQIPNLDPEFRRMRDGNFSAGITIGLGVTYSKKNSRGKTKNVVTTMPSVASTTSLSQARVDLVDVNGDGLVDRVSMTPDASAMTVQLNLGYRFGAAESWPLPVWDTRTLCNKFLPVPPIPPFPELDTPNALSLTQSAAYSAGLALGPIGGGVGTSLSRTVVDLQDINGDGLVDHLFKDDGEDFFRVKLNLGEGWSREQHWHVPPWQTELGGIYNPLGLFQCLDSISYNGAINGNGSVGVPVCVPLVPPIVVAGLQIELSAQAGGGPGGVQLMLQDMDGNGLADHVLKKDGDSSVYVKLNQVSQVNLLNKVTRPLGGAFSLTYKRQGNRVVLDEPGHLIDMPDNQWVLATTTLDDGRKNSYTTSYEYFDDAFYDRKERESYGYARVMTTLPDGSTLDTLYHNQDYYLRQLARKTVRRDAQGQLYIVETSNYQLRKIRDKSYFPELAEQATYWYEGITSSEADPGKSTRRTFRYDSYGNVAHYEDLADVGAQDDVIADIGYHVDPALYIVQPAHITVTDRAGLVMRERFGSYTALGDLQEVVQVLNGGRDPATGQEYRNARMVTAMTYDSRGNLASIVDPSGYTLTYTYDDRTHTHVTGIRDSFGYTTGIAYDLKYGLPTATTDENNNTMSWAYDQFGRLIEVRAPGDVGADPTLRMEYAPDASPAYALTHHEDVTHPGDPIGSAVFIDGLERTIQQKRDTQVDLGDGPQVGMQVSSKLIFDVMGRVSQQGQPIFSTAPLAQYVDLSLDNATALTYDILGRVRVVSFPQQTETRVDYGFGDLDDVKRLRRTRTDALGRKTNFYQLVTGPVVGVEQFHHEAAPTRAIESLITHYTYSPLLSVRSASDPAGHTTVLSYDSLGRRVRIDNPDKGLEEYRYDLAGNMAASLTASLRASGQQINYAYTFHRLDRIDYPVTEDVVFTYGAPGAADNRANRIATVTDQSGVAERFYSPLGQIVRTVKTASTIKGKSPIGPFTTQMTYDSFDRLLSVTYPDGEALAYGFDAGGRVVSATGVLRGETYDYVSFMGYDQFGQLVRLAYGNGIEERRHYDPRSRFLVNIAARGGPPGLFQNLEYRYDSVGSVTQLDNVVEIPPPSRYGGPSQQRFQYDDLYRLRLATGSYQSPPSARSDYIMAMQYGGTGNITSKNQQHTIRHGGSPPIVQKKTTYDWTYAYQAQQPDAPSHVGDRSYFYDLDGNQQGWTSDSTGQRRSITWDEDNRMTVVADQGRETRFLYDASGQRSNKQGQGGETVYVNTYFSIRNSAIGSKHVFVDGRRIATKIAQPAVEPQLEPESGVCGEPIENKLYFYHPDQLGSTQFVSSEDAELFEHFEYFPFGEPWVSEHSDSKSTPYLFTGKELDSQTELYYFGARYQDPRQSQFVSPDPSYDDMLDTGALIEPDLSVLPHRASGQMYAYAADDPVNLLDPTGLMKRKELPKAPDTSPDTKRSKSESTQADDSAVSSSSQPTWKKVPGFLYHSSRSLKAGAQLNDSPTYFSDAPQDHNKGPLLVFRHPLDQQVIDLGTVESVNWLYQQIDDDDVRDVLIRKTQATVDDGVVTGVGRFRTLGRETDRKLENWFRATGKTGWFGVLGQTGGEILLTSTGGLSKATKYKW